MTVHGRWNGRLQAYRAVAHAAPVSGRRGLTRDADDMRLR